MYAYYSRRPLNLNFALQGFELSSRFVDVRFSNFLQNLSRFGYNIYFQGGLMKPYLQ